MSEKSPGTRQAPSVDADLNVAALEDPLILEAIKVLQELCTSACGPKGRLKIIHNNIGGHVTVTSSSKRLLNAMTFTNPVVQVIVSAVNGHLQQFSDGGFFIIILATSLIKMSLTLSVPRHLLIELFETCLQYGIEILNGKFPCKRPLDFASTDDLKILIRSNLFTKVGCCLFPADLDFMVTLVLRAFLSVCPRDDDWAYGKVIYMTAEGLPVDQSALYEGTLIDTPHILSYKAKDWKVGGPPSAEGVKVALFSTSLSGDAQEKPDAEYEIEESVDATMVMLNSVKSVMDNLVKDGVRLVCCQRVVHPEIKCYLKRKDVTVLDRLGKINIQNVKLVTGGQFIGSISHSVDEDSYGWLDGIYADVINGRTYLHLKSEKARVSTVLLGHRTEETLEELKTTCLKCEEILRMALRDSRVLSGGGCWQSVLLCAIESKVKKHQDDIKNQLDCTSHQLQSALTCFTDCIKSTISVLNRNSYHLTDTANQHHWNIANCNKDCDWSVYPEMCECGTIVKTKDTVLKFLGETYEMSTVNAETVHSTINVFDSFPVMLNAFQTAVSTANLVLGIENVIVDKN